MTRAFVAACVRALTSFFSFTGDFPARGVAHDPSKTFRDQSARPGRMRRRTMKRAALPQARREQLDSRVGKEEKVFPLTKHDVKLRNVTEVVAQWLGRRPRLREVAGSIPTTGGDPPHKGYKCLPCPEHSSNSWDVHLGGAANSAASFFKPAKSG